MTTTTTVQPPDSKAAKALTARRAKALEWEAKEKEYADGQHANMIDGVWHCSNLRVSREHCSGKTQWSLGRQIAVWSMRYANTFLIPQRGAEDIVFGPGKFWHRHRSPLPAEYNSDPEFHLGLI
jgi:SWI/SNF-related matrix-associated actin-dependent regulator of chromatin subfamily B protein 1